MKWVYYIPTPPFKYKIMMVCQKYRCIEGAKARLWSSFTIIHVQKSEERGKTTWGKSSLNKGQGTKFEQYVFNIYLSSFE